MGAQRSSPQVTGPPPTKRSRGPRRAGRARREEALPLPTWESTAPGVTVRPAPPILHLFTSVFADAAGAAYGELCRHLRRGRPAAAAAAYAHLFSALAAEGWAGDAWRAHLAARVALDGNAALLGEPAPGLRRAAELDLAALGACAGDGALEAARAELEAAGYALAPCADLGGRTPEGVAALLGGQADWAALLAPLRRHARSGGAGPFAAPAAFRWQPGRDGGGALLPIPHPDLIPPQDLFGYEQERALVRANTAGFLQGLPANDVLLYGDRGTGKSSTVKSLLAQFAAEGLRLVELGRGHLPDLPRVCECLRGSPQRFIVYVDDLSFEEDETGYKDAKAALQGGLGARPANVLVYATSNRRHLVRERLSERPSPSDDDPRAGDATEEKLSLADRFGLTVIFTTPDQDLYLGIVRHLAAARGLDLPEADLRARALRWAIWYNGRSGRSARQFVDALQAELATGRP